MNSIASMKALSKRKGNIMEAAASSLLAIASMKALPKRKGNLQMQAVWEAGVFEPQ